MLFDGRQVQGGVSQGNRRVLDGFGDQKSNSTTNSSSITMQSDGAIMERAVVATRCELCFL